MKRKNIILFILILLVIISTSTNATSLLKINDKNINFNIEPEKIENDTLIPIEQFKNLEGFFMFSIGKDKFLIIYETNYYALSLVSNEIKSNQGSFNVCCKPIKINNHILVPFDLINNIFEKYINEEVNNEEKINLNLYINQKYFDERRNLVVEIEINNNTNESINLEFSTSQKYNIMIHNQDNEVIYNWENGMMFTQAFTNNLIEPDSSIIFKEKIDISDFTAGRYKLIVELKAIDFQNNIKEKKFTIY